MSALTVPVDIHCPLHLARYGFRGCHCPRVWPTAAPPLKTALSVFSKLCLPPKHHRTLGGLINPPNTLVGWNWLCPNVPAGKLRHREKWSISVSFRGWRRPVALETHHGRRSEMCTIAVLCRLHIFCRAVPDTKHSCCRTRQESSCPRLPLRAQIWHSE